MKDKAFERLQKLIDNTTFKEDGTECVLIWKDTAIRVINAAIIQAAKETADVFWEVIAKTDMSDNVYNDICSKWQKANNEYRPTIKQLK